jgi:hypothetical protein
MRSLGGLSRRASVVASLFITWIAGCDDSLGNFGPIALNATFSTTEDVPLTMTLMASDPDGDTLTFTIGSNPSHGTLSGDLPVVTYTPARDFVGSDQLDVRVSDGTNAATARIGIAVTPSDDAPVAVDDALAADEDKAMAIAVTTLLANDIDVDGDILTVVAVGAASSGAVALDGESIAFTPALDFVGDATFTYTISDGTSMATATVVVAVGAGNDGPQVVDDAVTTVEDTPVTIPLVDLLANDSDAELQALTVTAVGDAILGSAELTDGNVVFTPAPDANGAGSFRYTISDGADSASGTVAVTITAVNDRPRAVDDAVNATEDSALLITAATLLGNDVDVDGDELAITAVSAPVNGAVRVVGDDVRFTPAADVVGTGSFVVTVSDGALTDTATVTVTIAMASDPPSAFEDALTTAEDTPVTVAGSALISNDVDPDGDDLTVTAVGGASHGTVALSGGRITFTPTPNFAGAASFTYTVSDGGATDTGTVRVTVTPVNDAPVAVRDDVVADNEVAEVVSVAMLVGNDTDIDGGTLTISAVAPTSNQGGTVTLANGRVTYRAPAEYIGDDRFTYTLSDGTASATGTVDVSVGGVFASFESDDYTGWTLLEGPGEPHWGTFAVFQGATTLQVGMVALDYFDMISNSYMGADFGPVAPTHGEHVAVHFQFGEQSHLMTRSVRLPSGARTLSWDMQYANNQATHDPERQFVAVHILDANGRVLRTVYKTTTDVHPLAIPMTNFEADIHEYAGRNIKIQVQLEVWNGYFPAAFDNFRID